MNKLHNAVKYLKENAVDSTAMVLESNPVYAMIEVGLSGFSPEASISARMLGTGLAYGGMGYVYNKGRDVYRKKLNITEKSKEKVQVANDLIYSALFNIAFAPAIYAVSQKLAGEDLDLAKIAIGTGFATVVGAANGGPLGYAVDVVRDLSGTKECNRPSYPSFVKRQSSRVKKGILAGIVAASIAVMGTIYSLAPHVPVKAEAKMEQATQAKTLDQITTEHFLK